MIEHISNGLIGLGLFFLVLGVYGLLKYKDFYTRILVASKVDTVGFLLIAIGLGLRHGVSFFTGKLVLMAVMMVSLTPFVSAIVIRSTFSDEDMQDLEGVDSEDLPLNREGIPQESVDGPWI